MKVKTIFKNKKFDGRFYVLVQTLTSSGNTQYTASIKSRYGGDHIWTSRYFDDPESAYITGMRKIQEIKRTSPDLYDQFGRKITRSKGSDYWDPDLRPIGGGWIYD